MSRKIVLFGDSLFGRCGVDLITQLETTLGNESDVYNCAFGGMNSEQALAKANYIASLRSDVVLISLGTNDASPQRKVLLDQFSSNVLEIIDAFGAPKVIFFPPPPVKIKDKTADEQANQEIEKYNKAIVQACVDKGAKYIDSWPLFRSLLDSGTDYHAEDGVHFDQIGYDALFAAVKEKV